MTDTAPLTIAAHGRHAQCVAFSRSGRILLSGGQDAQIRLWSVPGFKPVGAIIGHKNSVNSISFSPDEKSLVSSSSDGTVRLWSFPEGRPDRVFEKQIAARFSPSGRLLATVSTKAAVTIWDVASGEAVTRLDSLDRRVTSMAFAPDEASLLVGGTGTIHRVSVPEGRLDTSVPAHDLIVASLSVSADGSTLVSTGPPGAVRFWSAADLAALSAVALETVGVLSTAFAPDSSEVSVGVDFHVYTVRVRQAAIIAKRRVGVKGVYGVAYSPDGKYLVNAAADGRLRVWTRG